MPAHAIEAFRLHLSGGTEVSALLTLPESATACFVFAHGAGAGMHHPFMAAFADALADRQIATLRYQFPFIEHGSRRPDGASVAQATVRAAVDAASRRLPDLPLFAGGKSFGGRMTSQAQAQAPLAGVLGLAFVGFPLHPAKKPSLDRAKHLSEVHCPMVFLQGTRDPLAELDLMRIALLAIGSRATLCVIGDADHSFHVLRRNSRRTDEQVRQEMVDAIVQWFDDVLRAGPEGDPASA